jgi:hypothetical protein
MAQLDTLEYALDPSKNKMDGMPACTLVRQFWPLVQELNRQIVFIGNSPNFDLTVRFRLVI